MKVDPEIAIMLDDVKRTRFYGSIEFKFEAGNLVLVRRTETIKPATSRNNREAANENG